MSFETAKCEEKKNCCLMKSEKLKQASEYTKEGFFKKENKIKKKKTNKRKNIECQQFTPWIINSA